MKMSNNVQPIYNYNIFASIYVCCVVECNTEIKFLLNLCALVAVIVAAAAAFFGFLFPFNCPTQTLMETVERGKLVVKAHIICFYRSLVQKSRPVGPVDIDMEKVG